MVFDSTGRLNLPLIVVQTQDGRRRRLPPAPRPDETDPRKFIGHYRDREGGFVMATPPRRRR
jgi:hypothetical protein